jgi:hypothetical protein
MSKSVDLGPLVRYAEPFSRSLDGPLRGRPRSGDGAPPRADRDIGTTIGRAGHSSSAVGSSDASLTAACYAPRRAICWRTAGRWTATSVATLWLPPQWPIVAAPVHPCPHESERPARTSSSGADRWRLFRRTYVRRTSSAVSGFVSIRKPLLYPSELRGHGPQTSTRCNGFGWRARRASEGLASPLATLSATTS